jgi:hypothetical protein
MTTRYLILIGLILNFVGTLFLAFSFMYKQGREKSGLGTITFGSRKGFLEAGIALLAIGFLFQVIGVAIS